MYYKKIGCYSIQAKSVTNRDVLALTGSLGAFSLSLQNNALNNGEDAQVTVIGGHQDGEKLEGLVERLKAAVTESGLVEKGVEVTRKRTEDQQGDLLAFALQMPKSLDNIIDFDIHCRFDDGEFQLSVLFTHPKNTMLLISGP